VAREGLRLLLQSGDELRVVAAEGCLAEVMDAIRDLRPSVAIFDKTFGLEEVMGCLRKLRISGEPTRTVVWGSQLSESEALRLLRAGADGVVRKTAPLEVLQECIESVAAGLSWIEEAITPTEAQPMPARQTLTYRELQVMDLIEQGLTNKTIAAQLGIRVGTVKIHLRHIFEKTGIHGRYGLALSGLRARAPLVGATM